VPSAALLSAKEAISEVIVAVAASCEVVVVMA
jgi:hypothetical protein